MESPSLYKRFAIYRLLEELLLILLVTKDELAIGQSKYILID